MNDTTAEKPAPATSGEDSKPESLAFLEQLQKLGISISLDKTSRNRPVYIKGDCFKEIDSEDSVNGWHPLKGLVLETFLEILKKEAKDWSPNKGWDGLTTRSLVLVPSLKAAAERSKEVFVPKRSPSGLVAAVKVMEGCLKTTGLMFYERNERFFYKPEADFREKPVAKNIPLIVSLIGSTNKPEETLDWDSFKKPKLNEIVFQALKLLGQNGGFAKQEETDDENFEVVSHDELGYFKAIRGIGGDLRRNDDVDGGQPQILVPGEKMWLPIEDPKAISNAKKLWRPIGEKYRYAVERKQELEYFKLKDKQYARLEFVKEAASENIRRPMREIALKWRSANVVTYKEGDLFKFVFDSSKMDVKKMVACEKIIIQGMISRMLNPGVKLEIMVVLRGNSGVGKSRILEAIAPDSDFISIDNYFYGGATFKDLFEKGSDVYARMSGKTIVEFQEVGSLRKEWFPMIKQFITNKKDEYRSAYGKVQNNEFKTFVPVGSSNEDDPLLYDSADNRRFIVLKVFRKENPQTGEPVIDDYIDEKTSRPMGKLKQLIDMARIHYAQTLPKNGSVEITRSMKEMAYQDGVDATHVDEVSYEAVEEALRGIPRSIDIPYDSSEENGYKIADIMRYIRSQERKDWDGVTQPLVCDALDRLGYERKKVFDGKSQKRVWVRKEEHHYAKRDKNPFSKENLVKEGIILPNDEAGEEVLLPNVIDENIPF